MNVLNLLVGLNSVILIFLVANVFKPFIGSYSAKKGENLATKEDIAQLTNIAEGIRAKISDDVWDRQKQWEMKRDIIFEMVRALGALHYSLIDLEAAYFVQDPNQKELDSDLRNIEINFKECNAKAFCAMYLTRLITREKFCIKLTEVTNQMRTLSTQIRKGNSSILYESKTREELRNGIKAVLSLARKELNIQFDFQDLDSTD